jgi:hypothetical protein
MTWIKTECSQHYINSDFVEAFTIAFDKKVGFLVIAKLLDNSNLIISAHETAEEADEYLNNIVNSL